MYTNVRLSFLYWLNVVRCHVLVVYLMVCCGGRMAKRWSMVTSPCEALRILVVCGIVLINIIDQTHTDPPAARTCLCLPHVRTQQRTRDFLVYIYLAAKVKSRCTQGEVSVLFTCTQICTFFMSATCALFPSTPTSTLLTSTPTIPCLR